MICQRTLTHKQVGAQPDPGNKGTISTERAHSEVWVSLSKETSESSFSHSFSPNEFAVSVQFLSFLFFWR